MLNPFVREGVYKGHSAQGKRNWENKPYWHYNLFRSKHGEQCRGLQNNGFWGQEGQYSYERKSHTDRQVKLISSCFTAVNIELCQNR